MAEERARVAKELEDRKRIQDQLELERFRAASKNQMQVASTTSGYPSASRSPSFSAPRDSGAFTPSSSRWSRDEEDAYGRRERDQAHGSGYYSNSRFGW